MSKERSRIAGTAQMPSGKKLIPRARLFSEIGHRGVERRSGDSFFTHPSGVHDILYKECRINDPVILAVAYIHDTVEDSAMFGDHTNVRNSVWRRRARIQLVNKFGTSVADSVMSLTKPYIDNIEIKNKNEANQFYHKQLITCPTKVLLVKMADRLHNLRTLEISTREQKEKQLDETRNICLPLFKRALRDYPKEAAYLLKEINHELASLNRGLRSGLH